jgi:zinc D-Ala-D-Ala carboxypeptidase
MSTTTSYEERAMQTLKELGIPASFVTQHPRPLHGECDDLVSIGLDMFGREQRLERRAASQWQSMLAAAGKEGTSLLVVSGFRSFDYQRQIIERKLAEGLTLEQITCVSALPGYSEHHTGRAIDIGTPGSPPLEEEFEKTPAFDWLTRRGRDFGFSMSYLRGNPFGIIYEPWHWLFRAAGV